jgi:hypothetical protein
MRSLLAEPFENPLALILGIGIDRILGLLPHHPHELERVPVEEAISAGITHQGTKTTVNDAVNRRGAEPTLVQVCL